MHIQSTKEKNKEKTKNFKIQTDWKSIVINFSEKMEKKITWGFLLLQQRHLAGERGAEVEGNSNIKKMVGRHLYIEVHKCQAQ